MAERTAGINLSRKSVGSINQVRNLIAKKSASIYEGYLRPLNEASKRLSPKRVFLRVVYVNISGTDNGTLSLRIQQTLQLKLKYYDKHFFYFFLPLRSVNLNLGVFFDASCSFGLTWHNTRFVNVLSCFNCVLQSSAFRLLFVFVAEERSCQAQ